MFRNSLYMYKKIWKYSKFRMLFMIVEVLATGLNTFVDVMFYKYLIDGVTNHKPFSYILTILGIRILTLFIYQAVLTIATEVVYPVTEVKITRGLSMELYEKVKDIDITSVDDSEFYDKYARAFNEIEYRSRVLLFTLGYVLRATLQIIVVSLTLAYINPIVLFIAIAGSLISMLANFYKAKYTYECDRKRTKVQRGFEYIHRVFYLPQYAKDIRTTKVSNILYGRYDELVEKKNKILLEVGPKIAIARLAAEVLFFVVGTGATSLYMIYEVYKKVIGVGDFVTGNYAVATLSENLLSFANILPQFAEHSLFINNYREVMEYESKLKIDDDAEDINPHQSSTIELKNVSYKYPNATTTTLNNINLVIKPGERIGLVGENGAGKSTLLKLIIRLYDPISGEIRLDNRPYRKITKRSLQDVFSIVEQDFQHYAFSIREDITFETKAQSTEEKVYDALKKVDLLEAVEKLPNGIDSGLTNEFDEEGINLSGGQLQRLAIARMIYQDSKVLIMDEPSSALDPISEAKMFDIIYKLAEDKTLILVSHRLSGVKDMDRILFMENGSIVEVGNHQELMNQDGKYANMFRIQAERYGVNSDEKESSVS